MSKFFSFTTKVDELDQAASRIERAAARGALIVAAVDAVNAVTKRADESLRRGETADINLSPTYVKSKTDMVLASPGGKPKATITTKGDLTILGNFGVGMQSRIIAPGIQRRAGPIHGRRSAGTRVTIRKSAVQIEPQWFVMRLRKGLSAGDKYGVFVRDDAISPSPNAAREGKAGKRHIYGPSPYQLFREQIGRQYGDIQDDLQRSALKRMGDDLEELIT